MANLAFGGPMVVYYSWLPDLASPDERDTVSSRGWAYGYLGGGLLLVLNLALFLNAEALGITEGDAVRICLASAGVWWGLFALVTLTRLRNHPHPRRPAPSAAAWWAAASASWAPRSASCGGAR